MIEESVPETASPARRFSEGFRVLAIDWGTKRVGLAVSDPLGYTAQGLPTMSRRNKQQDLNYLKSLARKHHVSLVLVGNPLQMDGSEGTQAEKARLFAKELEKHLSVEVRLWDERLTSMEAQRVLQDAGVTLEKRGLAVDRMAAVLLLQNFLDSQPRPGHLTPEDGR
jgi:putative Holliday junction resolvase